MDRGPDQRRREILSLEEVIRPDSARTSQVPKAVSVVLIYPNSYEVGISNLGFQKIYSVLNRTGGISCERGFSDLRDRRGSPISAERGRRISDFDVVAFSVSFELDYPNVVEILETGGVPALASERDRPLVFVGGICAFMNPEPLAPFIDLFFVGEGEGTVPRAFGRLPRLLGRRYTKDEILKALSEMDGIYVPERGRDDFSPPASFRKVTRSYVADISQDVTASSIVTELGHFGRTFLIEVGRGCGRMCRFCAASHVYSPPRMRRPGAILDVARSKGGKFGRIGLVGAAVSDYPDFAGLCERLIGEGFEITTSSFRADRLTPELIRALVRGGVRTLTIAPEAGTDRLRRTIGKPLDEDRLLEAVGMASRGGIKNLKLYFMIGLPFEDMTDVEAITELVLKIRDAFRARKDMRITISVNPFVPKAGTPFQWCPMPGVKELKRRISVLRRPLSKVSGVEFIASSPRLGIAQGALSMGDRRVGRAIYIKALKNISWERAFKEAGIDPDLYVGRRRGEDEELPWGFIDRGIPKDRLWREFLKAMEVGKQNSG